MGESLEKNAAFIEDIQRFAIGNITTDDYGEISVGNELSIVAHEYTHGLIYKYNKNLRVGDYKKEAAAINEGYADVMGLLISDSQDWVIRYPGGEELRDGKESIDYSKLETTFNKDKYNSLNEDYGHKNGLVLSKACYLMLQYGMTKELLAKIVKNSLFRSYYPVNPTYFDVKEHFWTAAKIESSKDTHILSIIQKAFDGVGVEGDSRINAESIKNILNCRVVSADIAGTGVQTPLEDVKIVLESKTHSPIFSLSSKNGLYGFYTFSNSKIINPGDYYITYIKEGYQQLTRKIKIEDSQYIYLDAAEMIPSENTEFGTVNFYVVDSETKNGIKGLSVYIYDNNEKLVYSSVTNGVGKITIPDIQSGYYSVYVKDLREYDSVGGKENTYVATDRFFSIVKKDFLVDHYIAVTPKKYSGLMRIILEWNEYPEDLDSHLKGYRDYAITGDNPNDLIDRKLYVEEFHILYNSKKYTNRGEKIACLDHDEVDGYGPETVTIFKYNNDKYLYYIYQYSEAGDLKSSGAVVRVYLYENGLQDQYYVFSVPQSGDGRYWGVFCYYPDGNKDGDKIVPLNSISYYEPLG